MWLPQTFTDDGVSPNDGYAAGPVFILDAGNVEQMVRYTYGTAWLSN